MPNTPGAKAGPDAEANGQRLLDALRDASYLPLFVSTIGSREELGILMDSARPSTQKGFLITQKVNILYSSCYSEILNCIKYEVLTTSCRNPRVPIGEGARERSVSPICISPSV